MYLALLLALFVAGAGAGPQPMGDPADWIGPDDYPQAELMQERVGTTEFDLMIDVTGRPVHCIVTRTSNSRPLDSAACAALLRSARFHPARDESGTVVPGVWSDSVTWAGSSEDAGSYYQENKADLIVHVMQLPGGEARHMFKLRRVQGADGSIESCVVEEGGNPSLEAALCAKARTELRAAPILDAAGAATRGVRVYEVMAIASRRAS